MTPSIAWLNVTSSDTSLVMISASTRMAVLICASPPLSASNPDRISSRTECSVEFSAPLRDSGQTVAERVLVFWWTGFAG
jgi:hypothetical protein